MALDLAGLTNVNEYYSQHYLLALFEGDLRDVLARWEQAAAEHPGSEAHRPPPARLRAMSHRKPHSPWPTASCPALANKCGKSACTMYQPRFCHGKRPSFVGNRSL